MLFDFHKNQFIETSQLSNNPFIVGTDCTLSEKEVYELYQKIKDLIINLEIPAGHPVCIYGEKEALFPVVMITLMSLNIPYIPIDAIMPMGRIKNIQEQTQSKVLINCSSKICEIPFDIHISKDLSVIKNNASPDFSVLKNNNDPIRYILFTSGSTGVPKGVQITTSALNNFIDWYVTWPGINKKTVFMNQAPFSFDVSLCDFIGAFACGSMAVLNDYAILKSGNLFLERLKQNEATTIVCTPAFIKMYISMPEFNEHNYTHLKQFIFMGEELPASSVKKVKQLFPHSKVINAFGPTEATIVVTYIEITDDILKEHSKSYRILQTK
jgi:D-alanine--poly(phosphoribitol) ligase subunit 1